MDFNEIESATLDERIRAWCLEQALESYRGTPVTMPEGFVNRADAFEQYIRNGKDA
jgi:hypothetical protein